MASAPQSQLPLFYNGLEPLSSQQHADYKLKPADVVPFMATQHAVPITVDEFAFVQRRLPIVFSVGDDPIPLALMSLNEGSNTFFDATGKLTEPDFYVPAYIRRYPFMLARLRPESQDLSLCFDPSADTVGAFEEGVALFADGKPTDMVSNILQFNEQFEQAGQRTAGFMRELKEMDLLMEGDVSIQPEGAQPFIYRGFQMINEEKLSKMRGDQLRKMMQSGMLPLIFAHLFSMSLMRDIFGRQMRMDMLPTPVVPVDTSIVTTSAANVNG